MRVHAGRAARYTLLILSLAAAVIGAQTQLLTSAARADAPSGVVSLTFDDSNLDQYTNAFPALQQYGFHGTFYTNTGYIGVNPGYMTRPQLQDLANAGNEIGGHTVLHPDLTQVSTDEATREVCQSRNTLLNWGFSPTSFAYPYGAFNSTDENIAQQCGYNSARADSTLKSPAGCNGCALSESIPPGDPYAIGAPTSVRSTWSLSDIESLVTQAENSGGWVPIIFHHVCDNNCDPYSVTPSTFSAFLAWLQTQNVSVQTVGQVIGGPVKPTASVPQAQPAPAGTNGVANASLENDDPNNQGVPQCWRTATSGSNNPSFAETGTAHSGSVGETLTMTGFSSGDAKFLIKQDLGQCAPSVVPGDQYVLSAWYRGTVPTRFPVYYRDADGGWHYWAQSPQFATSGSWAQATWATPAIPAGATALSFGANIAANGTVSVDDFSLVDSGGPPGSSSPTVSLTSPSPGATVNGQVPLNANASSSLGISKVEFLVNGVVVATDTSAPYTATWDSTTVGDGPVTITARVTDISGTTATSSGQTATVSNAGSRGGNMLANSSFESYSGSGSAPDCYTQGGTGTNSFTWSKSGNAHTGNWAQNVTITSWASGDRKLVSAQNASACSPRVSPGSTYTLGGWYQSNQPVQITAYYLNASGSWVYWKQSPSFAASSSWAHATWTSPAVPSGAVAVSFGLTLGAVGSMTVDDYTMTGN